MSFGLFAKLTNPGDTAVLADASGNLRTALYDGSTKLSSGNVGDNQSATNTLAVMPYLMTAGGNVYRHKAIQFIGDGDSGTNIGAGALALFNGTTYDRWRSDSTGTARTSLYTSAGAALQISANGDAESAGNNHLRVEARQMLYNGVSWDRQRLPTTFKTATTSASGDTAVWTPGAGKKFRLQRFLVLVSGEATQTVSGRISITFRDSITGTGVTVDVYVPGSAPTNPAGFLLNSGWIDLGNGVLSATANNVLNINLNASLTAGAVRVFVAGTEE